MVEFALVIPLLLVIVVGTLDFGRAIFAYNSISNAARSATRVAIVDQTVATIEDEARREAVGLDPITIVITYTDGGAACSTIRRGCIARVEVHHDWMPATPIINSMVGPITLESAAEMPVEHVTPAP
jgi:Flp pilus assembly protein TadG